MKTILLFVLLLILFRCPSYAQQANPQTWVKVTLGVGYERPVQIHIFADHYRAPWSAHYALTKGNLDKGVNPTAENKKDMLSDGESTGWLNISEMIYPPNEKGEKGGARLVIYPAYTYRERAKFFNATIEFSNQPSDNAIVKKFVVDYSPSTIHIIVPPNLESKENIAKLRSDREFEEEYGKIADTYSWPKAGKKPVKFPFFVHAQLDPQTMDANLMVRVLKTLSNFGFNGIDRDSVYIGNTSHYHKYGFPYKSIGRVGWYMKGSYSAPDMDKMRASADSAYESQIAAGIKPGEIVFATLMDEPLGEDVSKLATDQASIDGFQQWLKSMNLTPADVLVRSWDQVKPVTDADKDKFPALYYYTQKYRTIALGRFLAIQKQLLQDHWKSTFPVVANFSDGAVYYANFFGQGVDYHTLLHGTDQNAIWGEDWSNSASTYQDASYNVELMRAAARQKGQIIGHYLIAYAGRKGYDIRLKAVSEVARGVKIFKSFAYGPVWATHEQSPWQKNTSMWGDQAAVLREIGAVEDMLLPAMPQKAKVALLYSSASDVWNQENLSYGFERMNIWLALTHAQIPVDVVYEGEVRDGFLSGYKVCYLTDPNITRAAAQKLADWVRAGGTLIMTAGAGEKDEFNRSLDTLNQLLPYKRASVQALQNYRSSGRHLTTLKPQDTVMAGNAKIEVLSVKQTFANVSGAVQIKSTFKDGSPAAIRSAAGKGFILCEGYLPAIDYMRKALVAKGDIAKKAVEIDENNGVPGPDDVEPLNLNEKSYNPWQYPADIRNAIIAPVQVANVETPIVCNVPLVDAVYMTSSKGIVIPLANYTLQPIKKMTLDIVVNKPVHEVRSVYQGELKYEKIAPDKIRISLPLDCTDFVTVE